MTKDLRTRRVVVMFTDAEYESIKATVEGHTEAGNVSEYVRWCVARTWVGAGTERAPECVDAACEPPECDCGPDEPEAEQEEDEPEPAPQGTRRVGTALIGMPERRTR